MYVCVCVSTQHKKENEFDQAPTSTSHFQEI